MKSSEFMLAFNEICQARGLPRELVLEALKAALVSAYRKNTNASSNQEVIVEIDQHTGEPTIFAEKEVVDDIIDERTEARLVDAVRAGYKDIKIGDMVMMDSTPPHFGRIAAQSAKQVILQKVREAEREQLFEDFSAREGEIVNGTVQSVSGQHITIGLGRTEALLPRSQQTRSERYRPHDKIRVFVLEVRRTSRGPQIIVSRNHRNLLRRLLELEVPEIYNGQVDIKSIAREAGARSKVAVMALQPGVDPVGACVGMRGVRIQSIVRELNDEKIDVIEYDPEQKTFIAKALSPARVAQVFLEDSPADGKTATVVVPDDQLSLAIGREGQNARLAAKLTGWRIDIKSLTEAAADSLKMLDHALVDRSLARNQELIEQIGLILAKKEANRPITAEDYNVLSRFVAGVEGRIVADRAARYERERKARAQARKAVPKESWDQPLEALELPARIHSLLVDKGIDSVGEALFRLEVGTEELLNLEGFGEKSLQTLLEAVTAYQLKQAGKTEAEAGTEATAAEEGEAAEEMPAAEESETLAEPALAKAQVEAGVAGVERMPAGAVPAAAPAELPVSSPEGPAEAAEEASLEPVAEDLDDLARPLVEPTRPERKAKRRTLVVVPEEEEKPSTEETESPRRGRKGRQLVYDEKRGEVVVRRKRKSTRRRNEWEEELWDEDAL